MEENDKPVLIYATFPRGPTAEEIGRALVERGLAACVNIIGGMTSIYRWQGELHQDAEVVMLIKTRRSRAAAAMTAVQARHPYDNPALLILPVEGGADAFLAWIEEQTRPGA